MVFIYLEDQVTIDSTFVYDFVGCILEVHNVCDRFLIGGSIGCTEPLLQTLDIFLKNGLGSSGSERSILLILPLPPTAEREALPGFRRRLEGDDGDAVLGNGDRDVVMDELEMVVRSASSGEEEIHNLLRIRI